MALFDDFVAKYNGQPVEVEDPSAPDQCMDLAFAWCDFMGIDRATIRHQYAYQVWTLPVDLTIQYFDYIPNTPMGVPPQGALVIFNQSVGSAGHISIATGEGDATGFTSFDQNWAGAQYAKMVNHVYTSVYGWLVRKQTIATDPTIIAQSDAFIAVATKLNVAANKDLVLAEVDKLIAIEDQAPQKDKQLADAMTQIDTLNGQLTTLKGDHDTLTADIAQQAKTIQDQDAQIQTLDTAIADLKKQMSTPPLTGWRLFVYKLISGGR